MCAAKPPGDARRMLWRDAHPAAYPTGLQPPGLGEGVLGAGADDEVVEDSNVDERERLLEAPGDELVGLAGLGDSRRSVIVKEDHGGGVGLDDDARDLTRIHRGVVDRAAEENLGANQATAAVEQQEAEDLVRQRADLMAQILASELGASEDRSAGA